MRQNLNINFSELATQSACLAWLLDNGIGTEEMKLTLKMFTTCIYMMALLVSASSTAFSAGITADHNAVTAFDNITPATVAEIQNTYRFYYGHTSHGSQIMSGLDIVEGENSLYTQPYFSEVGTDLGHNGDTSWVPLTRAYLNSTPSCNTVMWSWCGGASDNTPTGINIYLNALNGLEQDFPAITFIYMTGHLDGTGPDGNLYAMNNLIRDYCETNSKILFDFADIESWDPDGNYYPDETDACGWCTDWCATHTCLSCASCAHSHCYNCYVKGKAFWWLMASILEPQDSDSDGHLDADDNCPQNYNPTQADSDNDTVGDACDECPGHDDRIDSDVDLVPDGCDECPGHDDRIDTDSDGVPDGCDECPGHDDRIDTDSDGVPDGCDECPGHDDLVDTDGDNHPNDCDNCPSVPNPDQEDSDSDGIGDACEETCCIGTSGNVDCSGDDLVTMSDLTVLIDHMFISLAPLCCVPEAEVDGTPKITMSDLTVVIDHLFINLMPLPDCP